MTIFFGYCNFAWLVSYRADCILCWFWWQIAGLFFRNSYCKPWLSCCFIHRHVGIIIVLPLIKSVHCVCQFRYRFRMLKVSDTASAIQTGWISRAFLLIACITTNSKYLKSSRCFSLGALFVWVPLLTSFGFFTIHRNKPYFSCGLCSFIFVLRFNNQFSLRLHFIYNF